MTSLVIAMLLCVAAAAGVLALVALPRLRGGDRLLTPDGREAVDEAARRARALAAGRGPRGAAADAHAADADAASAHAHAHASTQAHADARAASADAAPAAQAAADAVDLRQDEDAPHRA